MVDETEKYFNDAMKNLLEFGKEGSKDFNNTLDKLFEASSHLKPLTPALDTMSALFQIGTTESNLTLMKELLELSEEPLVKESIEGLSKLLEWLLEGGASVIAKLDDRLDVVWTAFQGIKSFFNLEFEVEEVNINDTDGPYDAQTEEGFEAIIIDEAEVILGWTQTVVKYIGEGLVWLDSVFG